MPKLSNPVLDGFDLRYKVGLTLLALSATLTFALTFRMTHLEAQQAEIVSVASNQRTLSQRIAFLANSLAVGSTDMDATELREELRVSIAEMGRAHDFMMMRQKPTGTETRFLQPLQHLYGPGPVFLDAQVTAYLGDARQIASEVPENLTPSYAALKRVNSASTIAMMQYHDDVVKLLEDKGARRIEIAKRMELLLWSLTILVLLLEAVLIFRPMGRKIAQSLEEADRAKEEARKKAAEAKHANDARYHFFRTASHELKTPLNAILGMASILRDKDEFQHRHEEINQLHDAGEYLLAIVNNIIEMNRIDSEVVRIHNTEFNFATELSIIANIFKPVLNRRQIEFEASIPEVAALRVNADQGRLRQVVGNLMNFVSGFAPGTKIRLSVEREEEQSEKPVFLIRIINVNNYIEPDKLELLFGDLFGEGRAGGERKVSAELGLVIAKKLITLMGGEFGIDSHRNDGTWFWVRLPFDEVDCIEDTTRFPADDEDERDYTHLADRRVLVVDDNVPNQMVAAAFLKTVGVHVEMADDGAHAVTRANAEKFDLILMDINMPVMDGIEATREIRQHSTLNKSTPIMALTAHVMPEEVPGLMKTGMQQILHKPVRKEALLEAVSTWINVSDAQPDQETA